MAKHAPEPWGIVEDGSGRHLLYCGRSPDPVTEARYLFIAEILTKGDPINGLESLWKWLTKDEIAATEQLVLAAPDLLRLARGLRKIGYAHFDGSVVVNKDDWAGLQDLLKRLENV